MPVLYRSLSETGIIHKIWWFSGYLFTETLEFTKIIWYNNIYRFLKSYSKEELSNG